MIKSFFSSLPLGFTQQLKNYHGELYQQISFIKKTTPSDSLVVLPLPTKDEFIRLGNLGWSSYFLFPRIPVHESDPRIKLYKGSVYRVKLKNFEYGNSFLEESKLNGTFSIVLLRKGDEGHFGRRIQDFTEITPTLSNLFYASVKLTILLLAGMLFVLWCGGEETIWELLSSSLLAGMVLNTVLHLGSSLAGFSLSERYETIMLGLLAVFGIILFFKKKVLINEIKFQKSLTGSAPFFLVGFFFLVLILKSYHTPIMTDDACAIWGAKAKAFFAFHDLRKLFYFGSRPQYPPLLPIFMAQLGVGGEPAAKLVFPLFSLCLYQIMFQELRHMNFSSAAKKVLPLVVLTTPIFFLESFIGHADLALAVFLTKSLILLSHLRQRNETRDWKLLCLMLCGLILVRPEGYVYVALISLMAWMNGLFGKMKTKLSVLIIVPWFLFLFWLTLFNQSFQGSWFSVFSGGTESGRHLIFKSIPLLLDPVCLAKTAFYFFISTTQPMFHGVLPILLFFWILLKPKRLLQLYPVQIYFLMGAAIVLFFFALFIFPLWGYKHLFIYGLPRYSTVYLPTVLLVIAKELEICFHMKKDDKTVFEKV